MPVDRPAAAARRAPLPISLLPSRLTLILASRCVAGAVVLGGSCLAAAPVLAREPSSGQTPQLPAVTTETTLDLPTIVVSATGLPTPAKEIPNSVTVITDKEITERQQRTVPDVLTVAPGLNVVQTGAAGGQTSVFIRGTNSNQVKVLIDGIDAGNPATPNGAFDFGQLLAYDLARLEVLRGPQSGLYGADALGGVVSITTKKGEGPPKASILMEGGSFGTFNQSGSLSGATDRINYAFSIAHLRAEATPVTPPDLVPPGQRINPNFYDNWTASGRVGVDLTENLAINLISRYTMSELLFTADSGWPSTPNAFRSDQDNRNYYGRAEAVWTLLDGRFRNVFGSNYTNAWTEIASPPSAYGTDVSANTGSRLAFDYRGEFELMKGNTLVFGLQQQTDRLESSQLTAENRNAAGFLQYQGSYADRLFLVANIRYDDNEAFGGHTTWRIAPAVIVPETETKLKGSIGTAFKAPSLSQLYVDYRPAFNFYGNPDLKPEESTGWDIGFEQPLANNKVTFGATYFRNNITNLIETNAASTSYENIGQVLTYGVESFVAIAFSETLQVRTDYTYTIARNLETNQELLRRPKNKVSTTFSWMPLEKLQVSATAVYLSGWVDGNRDFSISRLNAPGYVVVNLAANYQVDQRINVFARVDNLFDRRYEDPTGYLRPGLAAYAGAKVTW